MEEFRRFEEFRVGNYIEHDGRLRRIEVIENEEIYTLRDIVYGDILKSDKPISGIKLNIKLGKELGKELDKELVVEFGFEEIKQNNHTFFAKDGLFLIDYTNLGGYGKFCVYHESVTTTYASVKEHSCAIFYIHALQNFIEGNPDLTKVDFDDVINRLLKENYLFRSKFG